MNKKILISLSVIAAVAAIAVGGTIAYFSDTETSTGNTFTAGSLDLTVDSKCVYNGNACVASHWLVTGEPCFCTFDAKDLTGTDLFFSIGDVKPGDSGEDTISLHVNNNDACGFVKITKTSDADNLCTEPEDAADANCVVTDPSSSINGELDDATIFTIWADTCTSSPAVPGDNIYQAGCDTPLTTGTLDAVENWGIGKLIGGATTYYGMSWTLPAGTGNEVQSDSFAATMEFKIEQFRNQYNDTNHLCPVGEIAQPIHVTSNGLHYGPTGWGGWSCPANTTVVDGSLVVTGGDLAATYAWKPSATTGSFNYPNTGTSYIYTSLEEGYIGQNDNDSGETIVLDFNCMPN